MTAYAEQSDVENIYGTTNVAKWADMENTRDEDYIAGRITWAIGLASAHIDSMLLGGPYTVPFSVVPALIKDGCARLAGVYLYDGRGIVDVDANGNPVHPLATHRDMVDKLLFNVKAAKQRLPGVSGVKTYPQVVRNSNLPDSRIDRYVSGLSGIWFPVPSPNRRLIWNEIPVGEVDGVNRVFTLTREPRNGNLTLSNSGIVQLPGEGNDYQLSGQTITFEPDNAPALGANVLATYEYTI